MRILITGADGFIGRHLTRHLLRCGHEVIGCVRKPAAFQQWFPELRWRAMDFAHDQRVEDWLPRLIDIDAVINTVGIFREQGVQTFAAVHIRAPQALFRACAQRGVVKVIQISALGADREARSGYHLSKKTADDYLAGLPLDWVIVQPSLVYGAEGASALLFNTLAVLPIIPLPGKGAQPVQPVHIDDLVQAIAALLKPGTPTRCRVPLVGPQPVSFREMLARLRIALGLSSLPFVPVPLPVLRLAARIGEWLPASLLTRETLGMLMRGNQGDPAMITRLLGRPPRPVAEFIEPDAAPAERRLARLRWLLPLLKLSIALVWVITGIISLGIYPVQESYTLLARVGITGALAPVFLYGAALLDIALGLAILLIRRGRWLWWGQMALIGSYSLIITWKLPEFWLHPFGPLLKNLPLLVALLLIAELED